MERRFRHKQSGDIVSSSNLWNKSVYMKLNCAYIIESQHVENSNNWEEIFPVAVKYKGVVCYYQRDYYQRDEADGSMLFYENQEKQTGVSFIKGSTYYNITDVYWDEKDIPAECEGEQMMPASQIISWLDNEIELLSGIRERFKKHFNIQ